MSKRPTGPKLLIVEGYDDLSFISGLMEANVSSWKSGDDYLVSATLPCRESASGGKAAINVNNAYVHLKGGGKTHVAFVVDADKDFAATKQRLDQIIEGLKQKLIKDGIERPEFSYWIMPNNAAQGMIEDLVLSLIPDSPLLQHAESSADVAKQDHCAPFRRLDTASGANHFSKAKLRTWLAWQDEPGMRIGHAVASKVIDPQAANAKSFLDWFIAFYGLK